MEEQEISPAPPPNALENYWNLSFDAGTRAQVRQAALWAKFCAICAFTAYAIKLVVTFSGRESEPSMVRNYNIVIALVTIVIGAIVNYILYRFAVATARGMSSMDTVKANEGFNKLRVYFKVGGISLIIILCFVVLGLIVVFTRALDTNF